MRVQVSTAGRSTILLQMYANLTTLEQALVQDIRLSFKVFFQITKIKFISIKVFQMSKIKFISIEDDGWSQFDGWSVFTSPIDRELKLAQRRVVNFLESSCGAKVCKS